MEEEGLTVRLVRCPKCENLLPEVHEYSVYQCGGCGAVLRGKQSTPSIEKRPLERSDSKNSTRVEPSTKQKVSLDSSSQNKRETDEFEVGRRKGRIVHEKAPNLTPNSSSRKEKREIFKDSDKSRRRRLDFDPGKPQEVRHQFGFARNASRIEKGRFGNSPYSNEGPSSLSHLSSYNSCGDHITNNGGLHEFPRVQDLENDRAQLLKKLDELRAQLTRSCNVTENANVRLNGTYHSPHQPPPLPHQAPHHQYLPPTYHDPFLPRPSCSCSQCCNINWHPTPPKIRPFPSFTGQETTYGPHQLPCHRAGSFDLGNDCFGRRYPRRRVIISPGSERVYSPISGGAPFISCNCFELLKVPKKITLSRKNDHTTIKCAVCSALISLRLEEDNKLVATISSPAGQQKVNRKRSKSNRSAYSSLDYDKCVYNFQSTDTEQNASGMPDNVTDNASLPVPVSESQNDELTESQRTDQERVIVDHDNKTSMKDALVATEIDVPLNEYLNCDVSKEDDQSRNKKAGNESFFTGLIKRRLKDFSRSSSGVAKGRSDVYVNGQLLTDRAVKKAEKLAGPIHPGEYWYDSLAGFWGVMNQPCIGIIPPFIEEFDRPMPKNCAAGNTGVYVNGRELNQKDLDLLAGRGLPTTKDKSYIIEISGKVVDEDTGEELDALGRLAPTVERVKHGFGMKVPKVVLNEST